MAKFYIRLIGLTATFSCFIFLMLYYVTNNFEYDDDQQIGVDLQRRSVLSKKGFQNLSSNVESKIPSVTSMGPLMTNYTLVTDDPKATQVWGWPETKRALEQCSTIDYSNIDLPDLSVIICFHGKENISNLLHTVHGIYQRTPPHLLREIILIDDNSNNENFGQILEMYIDVLFQHKVKIYRSPERLGLIKARLLGIRMAQAEVVVCTDSHVEVQHGWAEPLLSEIKANPETLAAPYIDWMEKHGTKWVYRFAGTTWKTYFDWTFVFGWQTMSDKEIKARTSLIEPIKTPVIIGTMFAINKDYFEHVGAFDPGMQLWGGENLDLPIRVWLFGGRVVNVPCSRAGHLEVPGSRDYRVSQEWDNSKHANYKRFAETWADEYKDVFYMYTPAAKSAQEKDISDRVALKHRTRHNFSWFLKEIFPELGSPLHDSLAWGELKNEGTELCVDTKYTSTPGLSRCGAGFGRQGFFWSKELHMRLPIHILNYKDLSMVGQKRTGLYLDEYMSYFNESKSTLWFHWQNGLIIDMHSKLCMTANDADSMIVFTVCDIESPLQKWKFEYYTESYPEVFSGSYGRTDYEQKLIRGYVKLYEQYLFPSHQRIPTVRHSQNLTNIFDLLKINEENEQKIYPKR